MNNLQQERLAELSPELRLRTVPDVYSVVAQSAAAKSPLLCRLPREILRSEIL